MCRRKSILLKENKDWYCIKRIESSTYTDLMEWYLRQQILCFIFFKIFLYSLWYQVNLWHDLSWGVCLSFVWIFFFSAWDISKSVTKLLDKINLLHDAMQAHTKPFLNRDQSHKCRTQCIINWYSDSVENKQKYIERYDFIFSHLPKDEFFK